MMTEKKILDKSLEGWLNAVMNDATDHTAATIALCAVLLAIVGVLGLALAGV